ncbi:amino acid ABC transporter permease [Deltaproteobacteria bacterium OttesenSCG-928-M10]|nr:amino acid ABC transporter permease [Deltaproteobacteria bacterium OttesenSCG-928-M10]
MLESALSVFRQGRNFARLMEGLWVTVEISVISVLLSMAFGIMVGLLMTSRRPVWRWLTRFYLETIRVVPVLVLLFIFYYTLSRNFGINLDALVVAVLVFTLWGTAEMADLVRGAITSMPVHQRESGRAVGLTEAQINLYIIIPQAIRRLIPGVINLTTRMIKTTPFVYFINAPELMKVGQQIVEVAGMKNYMASFWVYGFIFLLYFIVCYPISRYSKYLEKRWKN